MGGYKIDLALLEDTINQMSNLSTQVNDWLTQVDRHVADLHLEWNSAAATAHRDAHERWMKAAVEMQESLDGMRLEARRAHTNYTSAFETNSRMWP